MNSRLNGRAVSTTSPLGVNKALNPWIIFKALEYLTPFASLGIDRHLSDSSSYSLHIRFNVLTDKELKYLSRLSIEESVH